MICESVGIYVLPPPTPTPTTTTNPTSYHPNPSDLCFNASGRLDLFILKVVEINMVTEYGQRYSIEIWKEMFGLFTEVKSGTIGLKLFDIVKSMTKENE